MSEAQKVNRIEELIKTLDGAPARNVSEYISNPSALHALILRDEQRGIENAALKQKLITAGFHKADKETHIQESAQFVKEATEKIAELSERLTQAMIAVDKAQGIIASERERLKEAEGVIAWYANPVNWHRFDYSFMTANNIVDDDCADYSHITRDVRMTGGKRARAYLSKTPKKDNA